MAGLKRKKRAGVAVHIDHFALLGRRRTDVQRMADHGLSVLARRFQVHDVMCILYRWRVLVAGFVDDVEQHGTILAGLLQWSF